MKTPEELNELKKEYNSLHDRLIELSKDELSQVTGGYLYQHRCNICGNISYFYVAPEDRHFNPVCNNPNCPAYGT